MCRWIAYKGSPILMEDLILKPKYSLIEQSLHSREGAETTNGDGFGVGWYDGTLTPGLYKSIKPAWNNQNLKHISHHIRSSCFLAHVRATTGTPVQQTNCHPFVNGNWLFVHNGLINGYEKMKRDLVLHIDPELYFSIQGTTDSEIMFYLALTYGLDRDPLGALEKMAGLIEEKGKEYDIEFPLQMTLGLSDGKRLFGVRYSTENHSRSLYHSASMDVMKHNNPNLAEFSSDARAIVSEPLNDLHGEWIKVPEATAIVIDAGEVRSFPFKPGF